MARRSRDGIRGTLLETVWTMGVVGAVVVLAPVLVQAQAPQVDIRKTASLGPPNLSVTEPAIAAGPEAVVGVFFSGGPNPQGWYAPYNRMQQAWTSAPINPLSPYSDVYDMSVAYAYHPVSPGFLAVAEGASGGDQHIITCHMAYNPVTGGVEPGPWVSRYQGLSYEFLDKPYVAAGDPNGPEFYIVFYVSGNYRYLWSGDGGQTWLQDYIYLFGDPQQKISGTFASFPAVYRDRDLYVAYLEGGLVAGTIRLVRGQDGDAKIYFTPLYATPPDAEFLSDPVPVGIPLYRRRFDCMGEECWLPGQFPAKSVPQIAVDPTDPTRLYVVYHDIETPTSHDVNVYCRVLRDWGGLWSVGPRIRINNDHSEFESDQFMPSISVDDLGRVHVIFYDDRNYNNDSDQPDGYPTPKFDVFYAYSTDHGVTWANEELWLSPTEFEMAMDFTLQVPDLDPREYIGIASFDDEVWTIYTGTSVDDPQYNQAVMSSNFVDWNP